MRIPRSTVISSEPELADWRISLPWLVTRLCSLVESVTVTTTDWLPRIQPPTCMLPRAFSVMDFAVRPESGWELLGVCRFTLRTSVCPAVMLSESSGTWKSPSTMRASVSRDSGSWMAASTTRGSPVAFTVVMLKASPSRIMFPAALRPMEIEENPSASALRSRTGRSSISSANCGSMGAPPPDSAEVPRR